LFRGAVCTQASNTSNGPQPAKRQPAFIVNGLTRRDHMDSPDTLHQSGKYGLPSFCLQLLMKRSLLIGGSCSKAWQACVKERLLLSTGHRAPLGAIKALVATCVYIDRVGRIPCLLAASTMVLILSQKPSTKLLPIVLYLDLDGEGYKVGAIINTIRRLSGPCRSERLGRCCDTYAQLAQPTAHRGGCRSADAAPICL